MEHKDDMIQYMRHNMRRIKLMKTITSIRHTHVVNVETNIR